MVRSAVTNPLATARAASNSSLASTISTSPAPGVSASVLGQELLTPPDIEQRYGTPGGHVFDGEIALDQLWLQRPSLGLGRYRTPIPGLFLGGSGSHPGGPFRGGAGALAARALLGSAR